MSISIDTNTNFGINGIHILIILLVVLIVLSIRSVRKPPGMPPGPTPLPFVGNVLQFRGKPPYIAFQEIGRTYGKIFSHKFGPRWVVVLNHIDTVREALIQQPTQFAGRIPLYSGSIVTENFKDIAFSPYSTTWKLHRKLAHSSLRRFATGEKLEDLVKAATDQMADRFDAQEGKPVDPKDVVSLSIYNILASLCFGHRYAFGDPMVKFWITTAQKFQKAIGTGLAADFFSFMRFIPTYGLRVVKRTTADKLAVLYQELKRHKKTFDAENIRDIFDALLHAQQEANSSGENLASLTDTHLVQTVNDLFSAGTDTTVITLLWTIALLAEHPDVQERAAKEIQEKVGHERVPSLADRGQLPYTEAVLMEVLRFSSIIPMGVPHSTTTDTHLYDYFIPKDTWVFITLYSLHFDGEIWEQPDQFRPERFLDKDQQVRQHPDSFLPFSVGRRSCLGEVLAKSELFLICTWLLQNYTITKPHLINNTLLVIDRGALFRSLKEYQVVIKRRPSIQN